MINLFFITDRSLFQISTILLFFLKIEILLLCFWKKKKKPIIGFEPMTYAYDNHEPQLNECFLMLIFANVFPLFLFIIRIFQKSWLIRTDTLRCSLILQCGQQITPKYISGIFSFQHQSMSSFFLLSFNIKSIDLGFSLSLEITQCL